MQPAADLTTLLSHAVANYANTRSRKSRSFFVADPDRHVYIAVAVPHLPRPFPPRIIVMARLLGDKIIIEEDATDRPLYEELMRVGIPRDQIVLVYAGETLPEGA